MLNILSKTKKSILEESEDRRKVEIEAKNNYIK